jgi:hypothetical protein
MKQSRFDFTKVDATLLPTVTGRSWGLLPTPSLVVPSPLRPWWYLLDLTIGAGYYPRQFGPLLSLALTSHQSGSLLGLHSSASSHVLSCEISLLN